MKRVKIQDVHKLLDLVYEATVKTGCMATVSFLEDYTVFVEGSKNHKAGKKLELCEVFHIHPHEPARQYGPAYEKCCKYFENLIKEAEKVV